MKSVVLQLSSKLKLPGLGLNNLMTFLLLPLKENGLLLSSFVPFSSKIKRGVYSLAVCSRLFRVNFNQSRCFLADGVSNLSLLTDSKTAFLYYRSIYNSVIGGFKFWFDELELVGLGYRLTVKGATLRLRLGFSHVLILTIPLSVFLIKRKKRLLVYSTNKADLTHFISSLLRLRKMSVYKIKGIKKKNQFFTLKPGKKRAK